MSVTSNKEKKAVFILAGIALLEGTSVILSLFANPPAFMKLMGFTPGGGGTVLGWLLAFAVTAYFVWHSLKFPSVREHLLRVSWLKLLALAVAISAGILEEAVFRRMLMDGLQHHGWNVFIQIGASALAFGLLHGIWGLMGRSLRAAIGATVATGMLGLALAIVYVAAGRSLAPCIFAHFLIDLLIEPGLVLAACRGEMAAAVMRRASDAA